MSRIYKEGQGKWSRSLLAVIVLIGTILGLAQLHGALPRWDDVRIPGIGFALDPRYLIHAPILILAGYLAFRLFNHPRTADFLIDTESELKNKVTWPSRKEEVNSSVVVVVTVFVLAVVVFALDTVFELTINQFWYDMLPRWLGR